MVKTAIVYTMPASDSVCPNCERAKDALRVLGFSIEERDVEALVRGDYYDIEALAELSMNDGAVPVVIVGGEVVHDLEKLNHA